MRVLAIDAAGGIARVGLWDDDRLRAEAALTEPHGQAARLPGLVRSVLAEAGMVLADLDGIAATVGPGSFTGLRAALALAQGLGFGADRPVVGVRLHEALFDDAPAPPGRVAWAALHSRRGHVFLDDGAATISVALDALPRPPGPVAIAGNAADAVLAAWLAGGIDAVPTGVALPSIAAVARIGARRIAGSLPPLPAQPLYVDAPLAALPAGGLRAAPV